MATGSSVINYAKKFLGYGSSTFTSWYGVSSGTTWCDIFVSYVMAHCGVSFPKAAYVPTTQQWLARNATMVKMSEAQAGDVVIFTWSGGGNNTGTGSRDHIGFMIGRNSNGTFTTIEGNTSGNRVAIRTRYAVNIYGIYRPKYSDGSTAPSTSNKPSTSTSGTLYYVSTSDGLNVRAGAGTGYKIIDTLPKGTPVKVVKTANGFGYSNGARGWVCLTYLSRSKSSTNSGVKTSTSGYSTGMYHVNSKMGLNVRAGAGTGYRRVGLLRNNIPLKIVKVCGSWGYSNGAHGWVCLSYCRKG